MRATKLNDVTLSPRRDLAAVWGWHGVVVVSTESLATRWDIDAMMPVFSPDNRDLAVTDLKGVSLYSLATRSPRARLEVGKAIEAMAYSEDGKLLATAVMSGPIHVWDIASGQRTATLPASQKTTALAFDRQRAISRWYQGMVQQSCGTSEGGSPNGRYLLPARSYAYGSVPTIDG